MAASFAAVPEGLFQQSTNAFLQKLEKKQKLKQKQKLTKDKKQKLTKEKQKHTKEKQKHKKQKQKQKHKKQNLEKKREKEREYVVDLAIEMASIEYVLHSAVETTESL